MRSQYFVLAGLMGLSLHMLFSTTYVIAQGDVYLPHVPGAKRADVVGIGATPTTTPDSATPLEFPAAASTENRLDLPTTELNAESRRQDTDGAYALMQTAQAAAPAVYDDPYDFTVGGYLGVGTEWPSYKADILHNINGVGRLRVQNLNGGGSAMADVVISTGPGNGYAIQKFGPSFSQFSWGGFSLANWARFRSDSGVKGLIFTTGGSSPLVFGTNDQERMRISPDGQVTIGADYECNYNGCVYLGPAITMSSNGQMALNRQVPDQGFTALSLEAYSIPNYPFPSGTGIDIDVTNIGIEIGPFVGTGIVIDSPLYTGLVVTNPDSFVGSGDGVRVENGNIRVSGGSFIDDGTTLSVPDYVFEDDYPLMSLDELSDYIDQHRHLPNVPSEANIRAYGVDLSAFSMSLLEKVEEQTLYIMQLENENRSQADQIVTLRHDHLELEGALNRLEVRLTEFEESMNSVLNRAAK